MLESGRTLAQLLALPAGGLPAGALSVLAESARMSTLKGLLLKQVTGVPWGNVLSECGRKVGDLLDIDPVDLMIKAWRQYGALVKYADPEKYPPEEVSLVPLAEHTVESEFHPYLEVVVNNQPVAKIVFDVSVALELKGLILKIQGGRIKAIETGSVGGKGSISVEGVALVEKEFEPESLPGTINLGEGIAIS